MSLKKEFYKKLAFEMGKGVKKKEKIEMFKILIG